MNLTKILWATVAALTKILRTAVAVLMPGAFALGCLPPPPEDAPVAWNGSLCAASERSGEHCVPSQQDPADAWSKAATYGDDVPIQMWATWPSDMTIDDLVQRGDNLRAWFADIDRVLAYVRDEKRSAESYRASMAGNLGTLLQQAKDRQAELLAQKPVDPIGSFKRVMNDKATAEKDPLVAKRTADTQAMMAVQGVFDRAKSAAAPLQAAYAKVSDDFTTYRATEAAETEAYAKLAQQASAASLDTLMGVEQAILAAAQGASKKPLDLVQSAMNLSAQIQTFELDYQSAITSHSDFLATHGAARPDLTSSAQRSLNAMLGYVQQRVARSDATATSLLSGVAMRRQALVLLNAPKPVRDNIAQARLLKARATFQDTSAARVAALLETPKLSAKLQLPYLAQRYDQLTAFVQLQPLCDPSSSSWREAGCSSLRSQFSAAETSLKTTLPMLIQTGLAAMRAKGVEAALLDAAEAKLKAGDVKGATLRYDAAVRSAEGT